MVEKFQKILEQIITERGQVVLFGIFKMDDLTEKWSVILSASWISNSSRAESFAYIQKLINSHLTVEEGAQIARIGIFPTNEHLIELLSNFRAGSRIQDQPVNGNVIHDGYVLASNLDVEPRVVPL